ncbi:MAG: type I 3-dehydroquinate dehydratase [Thermoplasmata archaeon]|nr:type I 3-dehydroquinate dehydratase [Thermoplasmata archaeon]
MSAPRPAIVVSLPARNVAAARRQIEEARTGGADFAEIRLDLWPSEAHGGMAGLFPSPLPLLATLRSRAEGGEGPDDDSARARILRLAFAEPFSYVDLELARDRRLEGEAESLGRSVVRSAHLPSQIAETELALRVREGPPKHGIVKLVVPATFSRAVRELVPLIGGPAGSRPVLLTTGASGPVWRAWSRILGLPWVFAALPEASREGSVEPAQIPVDRLARFLAHPDGPVFAVVGHPVAHSRSPTIHHVWMTRGGHGGLYVTLDLDSPEEFRLAIEVLPSRGFRGLNVTHPWKRLAYECAGSRSAEVLETGVANCLTFQDGRIEADNTDLRAMLRRLIELKELGRWDGGTLTVLGGGGAARSTLAAAVRVGCQATVLTRRRSDAVALAAEFGVRAGNPRDPVPASLIVQATDVGRKAGESLDLPLQSLLSPESLLMDWVYDAQSTVIADAAREAGATYEDGSRLLVYQAAESYQRWWGESPDAASVEACIQEVRCAV